MKKFFVILLLPLLSCQTLPKPVAVEIPAALTDMFSQCIGSDGLLTVDMTESGKFKGSADMEWIARLDGSWSLVLLDFAGATLLSADYDAQGKKLQLVGSYAKKLPELSLDKAGFIEADGKFSGLHVSEVPCLLNFRLPKTWLENAVDFQDQKPARIHILSRTNDRAIAVDILDLNDVEQSQVCSTISWSRFLGLWQGKWEICLGRQVPSTANLKVADDYHIRWVANDAE